MKEIIQITELTKTFGKVKALDQLNLTVEKGEVHGFLGPNGAGKSTTIRVLLGHLKKTSGEVKLFGENPWDNAVELHKNISYIPGEVNLWPNLTGGEVIDLFLNFRGGINEERKAKLLEDFNLDPSKKCRAYSKGNRQKVVIIAALAADVDLYILDEPSSGLDPLMQSTFQKYITELKNQGKTILLSSHVLAEVEALCDRVTIIKDGQAIETGILAQMQHLQTSTITLETNLKIENFDSNLVDGLVVDGNKATFKVESKNISSVLDFANKFQIISLKSQPPTLEELFLRHYDFKKEGGN